MVFLKMASGIAALSFARLGLRKGLRWTVYIVFRLSAIYFRRPYSARPANFNCAPAKQLVLR